MLTAEDLIPRPADVGAITEPSYPFPISHLDKFPVTLVIPDRVWKIFTKIGTDETYTLIAEALYRVSLSFCITGNRIYIKKLGLSDNDVNCVATWLEKEEGQLKDAVQNWRKHILNTLFNNYKQPKTTFSEYKANQFIRLWSRSWLDGLRQKDNSVLSASELVDHLIASQINLDKGWLNLWNRYQIPGEKVYEDLVMMEACVDEKVEAYETEPEPRGEFLPSNGLREIITGPQGNRYPSPKRRKGSR